MNQFLDKLNIGGGESYSTKDRLTIFQEENARVAYAELSASCWKLLDTLARLEPDFRVDTGSSIIASSSSTDAQSRSIQAPVDSSLETLVLYAVLGSMTQCAIERRLDGESFESETNNILNCNLKGYQHALERFVTYVESHYEKNKPENTDHRTPVADQMAATAVHAFIGYNMDVTNNYTDDMFNQLQEQIFCFKDYSADRN